MKDYIRVSKLMSERGLCSRREADDYIQQGFVLVNGQVVQELGTKVDPCSEITLKKEAFRHQDQKITILLNKPLGYVSCQPEKGYKEALVLITPENQDPKFKTQQKLPFKYSKMAVAGRLDINSKGLLVFTQDGRIAKQLIQEDSSIEKEYLVRVEGDLTKEKLQKLSYGLSLDGQLLKRAQVDLLEEKLMRFILRQGRKRQIRRMCELVDLNVISIKRVRIGKITLGSLKEGCWRFLEAHEAF